MLKKVTLGFMIKILAALAIAGGICAGAFVFWQLKYTPLKKTYNLSKAITISGKIGVDNSQNGGHLFDFPVSQYMIPTEETNIGQENEYLFDKNSFYKFVEYMDKNIYHGAEIINLSGIILGNTNVIHNKSVNGVYYPATKQIFINTSAFSGNHFVLSNDPNADPINIGKVAPGKNKLTWKEAVISLMSVITHEYGHHIANEYFSSATTNFIKKNSKEDEWIWTDNVQEERIFSNWNPFFVNSFRKLLYPSNTDSGTNVSQDRQSIPLTSAPIIYYPNPNGSYSELISNYYNASTLFAMANQKAKPQFPNLKDKASFGLYSEISYEINLESLAYTYNMSERFTRMMQQIMYPYKLTTKDKTYGFYGSSTVAIDAFIADKMASNIDNKHIYMSDAPYGGIITGWGAFPSKKIEPKNDELYTLYLKGMRYGKSVSLITSQLSASTSDGVTIDIKKEKPDNLKITGWIDRDEIKEVNGIVLVDLATNEILSTNINYDTLNGYNFTPKKALNDDTIIHNQVDKVQYWTDFINLNKLKDDTLQIYKWKDTGDNIIQRNELDAFYDEYKKEDLVNTYRTNYNEKDKYWSVSSGVGGNVILSKKLL